MANSLSAQLLKCSFKSRSKLLALMHSMVLFRSSLILLNDGDTEHNKHFRAVRKNLPAFTTQDDPLFKAYDIFMLSNIFVSFVSIVEGYLQDITVTVLKSYPEKMGDKQIPFNEIRSADTIEEIVEKVVFRTINELIYKKPKEYWKFICDYLSLDDLKINQLFFDFVELKARRDVGVHNNWTTNEIYVRKLAEVNLVGEANIFVGVDHDYLSKAVDLGIEFIECISQHCEKKFD
jgi:hypothetical protein